MTATPGNKNAAPWHWRHHHHRVAAIATMKASAEAVVLLVLAGTVALIVEHRLTRRCGAAKALIGVPGVGLLMAIMLVLLTRCGALAPSPPRCRAGVHNVIAIITVAAFMRRKPRRASAPTTRVQLEMPPQAMERLQKLKDRSEASSTCLEVIRNRACACTKLLVEEH